MRGEAVQRDTISAPCTQEERAKWRHNSTQTPIIHARKQSNDCYYQRRALACVRVQSVHFFVPFYLCTDSYVGPASLAASGGARGAFVSVHKQALHSLIG